MNSKFILTLLIIAGILAAGWLFIFIVIFTYDVNPYATVYPEYTDYFYVEDYSKVLNEETENFILDEGYYLEDNTGVPLVVVAVPNTHEDRFDTYCEKLAEKWQIAHKDNGIMVVFCTGFPNRKQKVVIGEEAEDIITEERAKEIIDSKAKRPSRIGKWNEAAGNTFSALASEIYTYYGYECPEELAGKGDWGDGRTETENTVGDAQFPEKAKRDVNIAQSFLNAVREANSHWGVGLIIVVVCGGLGVIGGKARAGLYK
ncbi:MAG: TPM domain-containing protein [Lachnospiraceae bacterium]|nr:TPM domain-containing protein [Lachnospiraceae bacterium]